MHQYLSSIGSVKKLAGVEQFIAFAFLILTSRIGNLFNIKPTRTDAIFMFVRSVKPKFLT